MLLCKPEEDVHDGAAGSFVGLEKHHVRLGVTGSQLLGGKLPHSV